MVARTRRGLFCIYHADRKGGRTGLEPLLGTCTSLCRNQSGLIQLRQSLMEASDACVVEVSRLMEPHDDGTGMVHPLHSTRVLCRTGKDVGRCKQSDSRSAEDFDRGPATGSIVPVCLDNVGRGGTKHILVSFLADGQGLARIVRPNGSCQPDVVLKDQT